MYNIKAIIMILYICKENNEVKDFHWPEINAILTDFVWYSRIYILGVCFSLNFLTIFLSYFYRCISIWLLYLFFFYFYFFLFFCFFCWWGVLSSESVNNFPILRIHTKENLCLRQESNLYRLFHQGNHFYSWNRFLPVLLGRSLIVLIISPQWRR